MTRPSHSLLLPLTPPRCCLRAGALRAELGAASCGALLALASRAPPQMLELFTTAWCVHEVWCRQLELSQRALHLWRPAASTWAEVQAQLQHFTASLHAVAVLLRAASGAAAGGARGALDASMADWLDGRLLHLVAAVLWERRSLNLSAAGQAQLAGLQKAVKLSAAAFAGSLAGPRPGLTDVAGSQLATPAPERPPGPPPAGISPAGPAATDHVALLPVSNGLVEAVMAGSSALAVYDVGGTQAQQAQRTTTTYLGNFHYHTGDFGRVPRWPAPA